MNIHEYQAKAILRASGAPVARGTPVLDVDGIENAVDSLPGPVWVVKSQIHAGGRGKGRFREAEAGARGGVCLAHSRQEAIEHARAMFGHHLVTAQTGPEGKQVNRLYIEDGADIDRELYLSLLVDRVSGKIAFIASTEGGMNIEDVARDTPGKILTLPVADTVQTADAQRLCDALSLDATARADGMKLFPDLMKAFVDKDMSMLEINPLVVMKDGHLRVLDAKVSLDANALFRHPDMASLRDCGEEDVKETEAAEWDLSYIALDGTIGCMVNGAGLAMATMDIIKLYGARPANFCDVGGGASAEKVAAAFRIIMQDPAVQGILINIFGGIMRCDVIAEGVVQAVREVDLTAPLVVRLEGTNVDKGKAIIAGSGLNVIPADDLDDAARKIVAAVKGG